MITLLYQTVHVRKNFTPLTDGAVHISFLHFILAHYISAFIHIQLLFVGIATEQES